jgi:hypothetical protein
MFTAVGTSRRSTTARRGTVEGQSWVDQMRSAPEVIFSTSDEEETSQVQAGVVRLVSLTVSTTGLTAKARPVIEGTAVTSLLVHGPVGCASAGRGLLPRPVAAGLEPVAPPGRTVDDPDGAAEPDGVEDPDGVGDAEADVDWSAPTGCAEGSPPELPPPSNRPIANTSPSATTRTRIRRVQYTRGGSGPLGCVRAVMSLTVCAPAPGLRLPHRGVPGPDPG